MVWVKVCGMTTEEDALVAVAAGADAVGMLFAPSVRRISPAQAVVITRALPQAIERVGVFYDEQPAVIEEIVGRTGLTAVQLHGDESPEFARQLFRGQPALRCRIRVLKTLHMTAGVGREARRFVREAGVDGLLLDTVVTDPRTGAVSRGGTGRAFEWKPLAEWLPGVPEEMRVVVAGGLTAGNVGAAIHLMQPWGVDVCSGVEREPGRKDPDKIRAFVAAVEAASRQAPAGP